MRKMSETNNQTNEMSEEQINKIDETLEVMDQAYAKFCDLIDDMGEKPINWFIDWVINTAMESMNQTEVAELVKYIVLNVYHCDNK